MSSSIYNQLTGMQNATAQAKADEKKKTGPVQEMNQDMFLTLMMEQLKQQDPTNPMDNTQFLAQQAQFTQISELQKMNELIAANNQVMQASSLIGKTVSAFDPKDTSKVITGVATEAMFSSNGVYMMVNGKSIPLTYIFSASSVPPTDNTTDNTADKGTESEEDIEAA